MKVEATPLAKTFPINAAILRPRSLQSAYAFQATLTACGHELLEDRWLGTLIPHKIRCVNGHLAEVTPNCVQQGQGACRYCARGSDRAFTEFEDSLTACGHELLEGHWLGARIAHKIRCVNGHLTEVSPNHIQQGWGACRYCAWEIDRAFTEFKDSLTACGHELLEDRWLGTRISHKIRCVNGHLTEVNPGSIRKGQGACQYCWVVFDIFYVLTRSNDGNIKFGITSRDPKNRLSHHRHCGYNTIEFLATGLPVGLPEKIENQIKDELKASGFRPKYGREYFGAEARETVLKLAREHLADYAAQS